MAYIQRELQPQILSETPPKAIVIFGARQIGKTTLLTELAKTESSVRWFNGGVSSTSVVELNLSWFCDSNESPLNQRTEDSVLASSVNRVVFPI